MRSCRLLTLPSSRAFKSRHLCPQASAELLCRSGINDKVIRDIPLDHLCPGEARELQLRKGKGSTLNTFKDSKIQ